MPIYEYVCKECETKFEKLLAVSKSDRKQICPKCGSMKTSRELSVFAVATESSKSKPTSSPGMCGRCGGPGPCGM